MQIRIRETGQVMYEGEFRSLFVDTSFPQVLTSEVLNDAGADPVLEGPQPTTTEYQSVARDGVEQIDGQWFTKYIAVDFTQEQIDAAVAAKKAANGARAKAELTDTDWCENASVRNTEFTPHLTNGSEWDAYRLILRAIVIDPPEVVETWPTRPNSVWSS